MAKIHLDKYYTSYDVAEYCFKKALEVIGLENISEFIESSAGKGVFIDVMENIHLIFPIRLMILNQKMVG